VVSTTAEARPSAVFSALRILESIRTIECGAVVRRSPLWRTKVISRPDVQPKPFAPNGGAVLKRENVVGHNRERRNLLGLQYMDQKRQAETKALAHRMEHIRERIERLLRSSNVRYAVRFDNSGTDGEFSYSWAAIWPEN
jgi:hypothetical protein